MSIHSLLPSHPLFGIPSRHRQCRITTPYSHSLTPPTTYQQSKYERDKVTYLNQPGTHLTLLLILVCFISSFPLVSTSSLFLINFPNFSPHFINCTLPVFFLHFFPSYPFFSSLFSFSPPVFRPLLYAPTC